MALRKVEVRKVEVKVKPSHARVYDEHGKVAKGMVKKLDATPVAATPPSNGHSAKNGASPAAEAPVRGRPGRKPKVADPSGNGADAVPEAVDSGDDTADPSVQIVEKMSATKLRAKDRRAKEKALKEALERSYHGTEEDLETRRNKLKALIKLGKERGFLTYAEINDHLPDDMPRWMSSVIVTIDTISLWTGRVVMWLIVEDCKMCSAIEAALETPQMQDALSGTRVVRLDAADFIAELSRIGVPLDAFPSFVLLDAGGRASDYLHAEEWDDDIPQSIAPVLKSFVDGTYVKRRMPWRGGLHEDETPI